MIRELCQDQAVLSTPCEAAADVDPELEQDLIDTMSSIDDCACLCANQIGILKAVCAYFDNKEKPHIIYNPTLVFGLRGERIPEVCLTHEEPTRVVRYKKAKVRFEENVDGKLIGRTRDFEGWVAQAIQHMCDHCKGVWI